VTAPRPVRLRTRLFFLVAVALLPLVLLSVLGLLALGRQQQEQALQSLEERARAIASAVDLEMQASIAGLEVLALSPSLERGNLRAFYEEARTAEHARDAWDGIILVDVAGRRLFNTRVDYGAPLPGGDPLVENDSYAQILRTRVPAVGALVMGPRGKYLFPVRVAVSRGGEARYVLTALVTPNALQRIVERQQTPEHALVAVFDAHLNVVARSRDAERRLGAPVTESLRRMVQAEDEGRGVARTLGGDKVYTAFSRTQIGGWGVALGVAPQVLEAPVRRSYVYSAAGLALSLAAGGLAAAWLARRISRPIAELGRVARAAGRGELRETAPAEMPEVDEVARALADAVRRLRELNATLETRVAERTRELERANAELAASNEQLESFSYSVSHDLRAPLRAVDGFAALLQRDVGGLPETARQRLQTVRASAQHMGRLIDALLAFSRLSRQPLARTRVDVAALARDCVDEQHGMGAVEVVLRELPACDADPQLLRQVLANLIGNAFKYSARAAAPRVEIGALEEGGATVYYVRDNGVGFDMQHSGKLFGVFQRLHGAEEFEGTGVGLAIVQRIVARHGGRVWAHAAPGAGATFFFTLGGG